MQDKPRFDRTVEDFGNVIGLEHVNTRVPDQHLATLFYVSGLGLTRDPYLMTGVTNMWVNVGRSQFHLPTGAPQVLRGVTGLIIPDRTALLQRLEMVRGPLANTKFSVAVQPTHVAVTCPWGNRIRVSEPGPQFGRMLLGMPYVEFDVPRGTADGIARFYRQIVGTPAQVKTEGGVTAAHAQVGADQTLIYAEGDIAHGAFDGHHVAIYIADFSGPYKRLGERGLVSQEDDQHQYRFKDLVDPDTGKVLFTVEHEVRSLRHPLYARPLVNRNPAQSNRVFASGYEDLSWSQPAASG
ncbi:MAG: VOC family protein [Hyphomicrobiaceae bacterium]